MTQSNEPRNFDVAVIGGGSAGYAAARATAVAGRSTVVIEGGKEVGGLCILRGCMPTKALLYAAEVAHLAREAATWGIEIPEVKCDWSKVLARKNKVIEEFATYRREQLNSGKFEFIRAEAKFDDDHNLLLSDGQRIHARHVVLTTGSTVSEPPIESLREVGYLTSDTALHAESLPKSVIVLGGGAVALEFAQFYSRMGAEVTLIQRSEHIARDFDKDAAEALRASFEAEGIRVLTNTTLIEFHKHHRYKTAVFEHDGKRSEISAEEIFFGLGREPNTAHLRLELAGINEHGGRITTNAAMRTSVPHIYAAGDCTGPYEIVHIAVQQGEIAAHNILHPDRPREMDYRLLSSIIFTDPQTACVGLTEKRARDHGIPHLVATYPFNDHGKSIIMNVQHGFVKLLADPASGEILGGSCVGPVGGELLHEIIVAMAKRMTVAELAATPHYHPTLAEIWTYPAEELAEQVAASR